MGNAEQGRAPRTPRIILSVGTARIDQPMVACLAACVAGVVSMVMCRRVSYSDGPAREEEGTAATSAHERFPWHPVVLMLVYYPAFCLVLMAAGTQAHLRGLQEIGGLFVYLAVLAFCLVAFKRFRIEALHLVSLPLAFGGKFGSTWGIVEDEKDPGGGPISLVDRCRDLSRLHGLTRREEDVLPLLAQGGDVPSIGEQLVLSKGTVRNHVQRVYRKFGVHSKEELVARVADEE